MELQASEKRFRSALIDAPLPIMLCAEDGEILQLSKVWRELLGDADTSPDLLSRLLATPKNSGRATASFADLFDLTGKKDLGEYTIKAQDATELIWNLRAAPLRPWPTAAA